MLKKGKEHPKFGWLWTLLYLFAHNEKMICWNQKRGWWRFSYPKGSTWASTRKYRRMTALVNRNGDAIARSTLPLWLGGLLWIENSSGKDGREEAILTQTHRNQVSWGSYDMALYFDSRVNREHLQSLFYLWYFSGTKYQVENKK